MPKKLKSNFFQYILYSLKAHAHYFTVFIYLETWRGAKLGIFTHFTFTNLPWCSQSMNSLMYTIYRSTADHRCDHHTSSYHRLPKKSSVLPPDGSLFLTLEFAPARAGFSLHGTLNLLEDKEKSGKFDVFWKKSGKSKGRKFLYMQIFNF